MYIKAMQAKGVLGFTGSFCKKVPGANILKCTCKRTDCQRPVKILCTAESNDFPAKAFETCSAACTATFTCASRFYLLSKYLFACLNKKYMEVAPGS